MKTYLKAILAVTGGVVGVGGGTTVAVTLRQTGQQSTLVGGGDTILASVNSSDNVTQEVAPIVTSEGVTASPTDPEQTDQISEPDQTVRAKDEAEPLAPALPVKEKENCSIVNSKNLNDVFYNLINNKSYFLVSCSGTNKDSGDEWSNNWAGLFPSELFSSGNAVTKFKMTTETTGSSDSGTVSFSSDALSPSSITGKRGDIWQAEANSKTFLVKTVNLETPSTGNIFLIFNEDIGFLRQSS